MRRKREGKTRKGREEVGGEKYYGRVEGKVKRNEGELVKGEEKRMNIQIRGRGQK